MNVTKRDHSKEKKNIDKESEAWICGDWEYFAAEV